MTLEERTYTKPEMAEIFGTRDNSGIKDKLNRRQIEYSFKGRGDSATFTITKIPNPFAIFCELTFGFDKQCDFTKIRNLYYFCFNDEEFFAMPDEFKEARLAAEGKKVSRQSIAKYLKPLYDMDFLAKNEDRCFYYFALGDFRQSTDKKTYKEAWALYWSINNETGRYDEAAAAVKAKYGGMPRKQAAPEFTAFYSEDIKTLIDLTNRTFEEDYGKK